MVTLYSLTILAGLALLAIVIAIFVFAASIYRGASEFSAKEEENALNRRKRIIESRKAELAERVGGIDENTFPKQLRVELDKLDAELNNIDQSILKSRNKTKGLTARNMIAIPSSFLLVSIITSGIAIATSGVLPTIMWVLSLALLVTGSYFICRNLCTVEFFSGVIDLGTLMEQALEKHTQKMRPIVDLDIWEFQLKIKHGETQEVAWAAFLKQGTTAKNVKLLFYGDNKLEFPEEQVQQIKYDVQNIKNPKYFVHDVGDLNYGLFSVAEIKIKAPEDIGEYPLAYFVRCDDYVSETKKVAIKVT